MISKKIQKALQGSSAIRAMFVEGNELAARVGRENVYDFSLGNPATPAPASVWSLRCPGTRAGTRVPASEE